MDDFKTLKELCNEKVQEPYIFEEAISGPQEAMYVQRYYLDVKKFQKYQKKLKKCRGRKI